MIMRQRAVEVKGDLSCPREWIRPTDLQDGAEKRFQSLPNSTARIEALQPRFALFPEEEPGCIVPPGTADNSPPFQRWDKPRSTIPQSPGGTAEALSEDEFQPSLRDMNAMYYLQIGWLHPQKMHARGSCEIRVLGNGRREVSSEPP